MVHRPRASRAGSDARDARAGPRDDVDGGWGEALRALSRASRAAAWVSRACGLVNARAMVRDAGSDAPEALARWLGVVPEGDADEAAVLATTNRAGDSASAVTSFSGRPGDGSGSFVRMGQKSFLEYLRGGDGAGEGYYAAQLDVRLGRVESAYAEDALRFFRDSDVQIKAWINGEFPVETNWHYDNYDNVLVVLAGRKVVKLLAPPTHSYSRNAGCHVTRPRLFAAGTDASNHCRQVNLGAGLEVDLRECQDPDEVVLEPGNALFIPAGWLHHVTSKERTVALSHWWSPEFNKTLESSEFYPESFHLIDVDSLMRDGTPTKDFAESALHALRTDLDSSRQVASRAPTRYFSSAIGMRNTYYFRRAFEVALEVDMHNEDALSRRETMLDLARTVCPSMSAHGRYDPRSLKRVKRSVSSDDKNDENCEFGSFSLENQRSRLSLFHVFGAVMFRGLSEGKQREGIDNFVAEVQRLVYSAQDVTTGANIEEYEEPVSMCGELRYATWDSFAAILRSSECDVLLHLGMWLQYAHMMACREPEHSYIASHRFDVIWRTIERLMDSERRAADERAPTWEDIFDGMRRADERWWRGNILPLPREDVVESLRNYSPYSFRTHADVTRAILANRREAVAYRARRLIQATLDDDYVVSIQHRPARSRPIPSVPP